MGPGEKKVAIGLVVVLAALVGAYILLPDLGKRPNDLAAMMPPGMAQPQGGAQMAKAPGGAKGAGRRGRR